jgi:hypothetical protein
VTDVALNVSDHQTGIGLIPSAIKLFGGKPKLDHKIAGQVLRFDLAALFAPKPHQSGFVVAHDDPGI